MKVLKPNGIILPLYTEFRFMGTNFCSIKASQSCIIIFSFLCNNFICNLDTKISKKISITYQVKY